MPLVNGKVLFNSNCDGDVNSISNSGIGHVPVVLRNKSTTMGIGIYTSNNGEFSFTDVPAGTYDIFECADYIPPFGASTPVSMSLAVPMDILTPKDIDINSAILLPGLSNIGTKLNSLSPNLQTITVSSTDITEIIFLDAPIIEKPYINPNLFFTNDDSRIFNADSGTFGTLPAGSPPQSSPAEPPYPNIHVPNLPYYPYEMYDINKPSLGHYSITNMITNNNFSGSWWNISDHTTGDESGRMQVCQSLSTANPLNFYFLDSDFFGIYNNYALLSFWVCNLVKDSASNTPQLSIKIVRSGDNPSLYYAVENDIPQSNAPIWRQLGAVINIKGIVSFQLLISNSSPFNVPHGFAIDDISFRAVVDAPTVTVEKIDFLNLEVSPPVITYIINVKNNGPQALVGYYLDDTIPQDTALISNSLSINDTPFPSGELNNKISVITPTIPSGTTTSISYKVSPLDIFSTSPIVSPEVNSYYYFNNPEGSKTRVDVNLPAITTPLNYYADLSVTLSVTPNRAIPGDILKYIVTLLNTGTTIANSIKLIDILPTYTSYNNSSLLINSEVVSPSMLPTDTLPNSINPNETTIISFDLTLNDPIPVTATTASLNCSYKYFTNRNLPQVSKISNSNIVNINTRYAKLKLTKAVDKTLIKLNDILTYTISVVNSGNVPNIQGLLTDSLDTSVSFVPNSLIVNNAPRSENTLIDFPLGSLTPGASLTLSYKVEVTSIPNDGYILNECSIRYNYVAVIGDINRPIVSANSNIVRSRFISSSPATFLKTVNKKYCDLKDTLDYQLTFTNSTQDTIIKLTITDTIPDNVSVLNNTPFVISGNVINKEINNILPDSVVNILYSVKVNDNTNNIMPITNTASAKYTLLNSPLDISTLNQEVTVQINYARLNIIASASPPSCYVNDSISYSFTISNIGNTIANNIKFIDILPSELELIPGSVILDDNVIPGSPTIANLSITDIPPKTSRILTFKATVITSPSSGEVINNTSVNYRYTVNSEDNTDIRSATAMANPLRTTIISPLPPASVYKLVDKAIAYPSDKLTYSLVIKNTTIKTLNNIEFIDTIPQNTSLLPNSTFIDGSFFANNSSTIVKTLKSSLNAGSTSTLTFKVQIDATTTPSTINNITYIKYEYRDELNNIQSTNLSTEMVFTTITIPSIPIDPTIIDPTIVDPTIVDPIPFSPNPTFVKYVSKAIACHGDTLLYTVIFKNTSPIQLNNINFIDSAPINTTLIPNSIIFNGRVSINKSALNINVTCLYPGQYFTVSYKVKVNFITGNPPFKIENHASISYSYLDSFAITRYSTINSNQVVTTVKGSFNPPNNSLYSYSYNVYLLSKALLQDGRCNKK